MDKKKIEKIGNRQPKPNSKSEFFISTSTPGLWPETAFRVVVSVVPRGRSRTRSRAPETFVARYNSLQAILAGGGLRWVRSPRRPPPCHRPETRAPRYCFYFSGTGHGHWPSRQAVQLAKAVAAGQVTRSISGRSRKRKTTSAAGRPAIVIEPAAVTLGGGACTIIDDRFSASSQSGHAHRRRPSKYA